MSMWERKEQGGPPEPAPGRIPGPPNEETPLDETTANARQVGGNHYKTGGEEHWDRVARLGLDYFQGQITKYVERWKKKNGVEDLMKARHFLDKYIELIATGNALLIDPTDDVLTSEDVARNLGLLHDDKPSNDLPT